MLTNAIEVRSTQGVYVVRAGGAIIGETNRALELLEGDYKPVIYVPREDMAMFFFDKSDHSSACPFKGEATYYSVVTKSTTLENAAWSYENPKANIAKLKDYLAFYPSLVTVERI